MRKGPRVSSAGLNFKKTFSAKSKSSKTSVASGKKKKVIKRHPKNKFRAIVRKVINNLYWISDTSEAHLENNADKNAYILTHKRRDKQLISLADKIVLRKSPSERNIEDLKSICNKLVSFRAFRLYPESVKIDLLRNAMFVTYKPKTVIVRQGRMPGYVYYIISGKVNIETEGPDPYVPSEIIKTTDTIQEGETFGEVPGLYNEPHTFTVTVGKCDGLEVLLLEISDFKRILVPSVKKKWNQVRWAVKKFPYFNKFPENSLRMIDSTGQILTFCANQALPTKDNIGRDLTTFIIDGECEVIQKITVQQFGTFPYKYTLCKDSNMKKDTKDIFMQSCILKPRAVFGLGEHLGLHDVVSLTEVFVMSVPRSVLMRANVSNIWTRTVFKMNLNYPSEEELFRCFIQGRLWSRYKKKTVADIIASKNHSGRYEMTIHDTPVSVRAKKIILSDEICDRIKKHPQYLFGEISDEQMDHMTRHSRMNMRRQYERRQKGIWNKTTPDEWY